MRLGLEAMAVRILEFPAMRSTPGVTRLLGIPLSASGRRLASSVEFRFAVQGSKHISIFREI